MTTNIGCCGRRTNLEGFVAQADLHPVTTPAGRRARAAIAMAIVERAAMARGNGALAARARRGLQGLGTVQTPAQVQATITGLQTRATAAAARISPQFQAYLGVARGVLAIVQVAVASDVDATRVLAWLSWALGGPLPSNVAENDIRILNVAFGFQPALSAAISALPALDPGMSVDARTALTVIANTYLPALKQGVAAAYAALPPPATPPPAPPPPEEQVAAVRNRMLDPGVIQNLLRNPLRITQPTVVRCPAGTTGDPGTLTRPPVCTPIDSGMSPFLVALPAAAVLWYLFK